MINPEGIVPSDPQIKLFAQILAETYKSVFSSLEGASLDTAIRRKRQLNQIRDVVNRSDEAVQAWIKVFIPAFYETGMYENLKELNDRNSAIGIDRTFAHFHEEAIEAISRDTYAKLSEGMRGITRTAETIVNQGARQSILTEIAKGQITGTDRKSITKNVKSILEQQGITGMVDKSGREWKLDRYAEMLTRTKLTQAHNTGITNRMVESGYDLVVVSRHGGACDLCAPFEGKVLSITGRNKGYISMDMAQSEGLFHGNCRHVVSAYDNKWLDSAVAWDTETQSYKPYASISRNVTKVELPTFEKAKEADVDYKGIGEYITAFNNGDLKAMEKMRKENPEDARFNTHLKFLKTSITSKGEDNFTKIQELHNKIMKDMGLENVRQFNILFEQNNRKALQDFVDGLKDDPLKPSMQKLLEYI